MKYNRAAHLKNVLHHLYINPLEKCNLHCKICYTKKTSSILTEHEIFDFVDRYAKVVEVKAITFCGGEVMALSYFPKLVNRLIERGIYIQCITNGTIDRLKEFANPGMINLIVSLDGTREYHDSNRGAGQYDKSIAFLKKAKKLGFHTEIFSIVTKQNLPNINQFESQIHDRIGPIDVTFHPRKPAVYLKQHPKSNIVGTTQGFDYLTVEEMRELWKHRKKVFPPKELGCYQVALASDGIVYGCCEGFEALGNIDDTPLQLINQLKCRIGGLGMGCSQPGFMCGLKEVII